MADTNGADKGNGKNGVEAVERALKLLDAFHHARSSLTLADLAAQTGLFKSTILRMMVSLEKHGYVQRLDTGRYALGSAAFELGNAYRRTFSLTDVVRPVLEKLAVQTHESASFWIRDGEHRLCLCRVESSQDLRDALFREGERLLLDKGPTSTLLRAFSGEPGRKFDQVRKETAAVSLGLYRREIAGISCPAFGPGETLGGALTLTGPRLRFTGQSLERMKQAVNVAAQSVTRSLGGRNPYQPKQETAQWKFAS